MKFTEKKLHYPQVQLQLYRYKLSNKELIKRITSLPDKELLSCYLPLDEFDDWVLVENGVSPKKVILFEEDEHFSFTPCPPQ